MKPEEETCDEFEHIYEKWMDPDDLIRMMKDAGNVIFPNEDSVKFVSVAEKVLPYLILFSISMLSLTQKLFDKNSKIFY